MTLIIENLTKYWGSTPIIKNFNLNLEAGEICLVYGPSGSGKTSLIRLLNHLDQVDQGTIEVDGINLVKNGLYVKGQALKDYQQKLGLVFQDFQLFPNLTVGQNLSLSPTLNRLGNKQDVHDQCNAILKRLGIFEKVDAYPDQLSGGQKQRVAIARAFLLKPSVLCFDEPTSALDPQASAQIKDIIIDLAEEGMTIIVVSHDQVLIDSLSGKARLLSSETFINS